MHHAPVWIDIAARIAPTQRGFYARVFGWELATDDQLDYAFVETPDGPIGGIGQSTEGARHPPGIAAYLPVSDLHAALALATGCGGTCLVPPWAFPVRAGWRSWPIRKGNRVGIWQ